MLNITPKQKVTILLPRDVVERVRALAKRHRRSFNSELLWALEQYLAEQDESREAT